MKWFDFTRHWFLVVLLGVVVALTAASCGSEEDEQAGSADSTQMGEPGDVPPGSGRDTVPNDGSGNVENPTLFTTNEGDHGTIRLFPGAPNEMLIPLMQYQVTGVAPSESIHNNIIDPSTNVQVQQITPYGGAPPWPGPQSGPGITDQPVMIHGVTR